MKTGVITEQNVEMECMFQSEDTNELKDEVLVVKKATFETLGYPDDFSANVGLLSSILREAFFIRRILIENDSSFKQLISYVAIMRRDKFLVYTRQGKTEPRLRNLSSIGFGGHVTKTDLDKSGQINTDLLWNAARREVFEETGILLRPHNEPIGLVNENVTPVGKVHLGVFYLVELDEDLSIATTAEGGIFKMKSLDELRHIRDLEPWSEILVRNLGSNCSL